MSRCCWSVLLTFLLMTVCLTSVELWAQEQPSPSPAFTKALNKGEALMKEGKHRAAIKQLLKAERRSDEPSVRVLLDLAVCFNRLRDFYSAEEYARAALTIAEDPVDRASALNLLGTSILWNVGRTPGRLREVERAFDEVLVLTDGAANVARYNRAVALERLDRDLEALSQVEDYLAAEPDGEYSGHARRLRRWIRCTLPTHALGPRDEGASGASLEVDAERPIHVVGDMNPPVKIRAPVPQYTESARQARIQGTVIIQAIIEKDGEITSARVLQGLPFGLEEAALRTFCGWEFEPATLSDGRPVAVFYTITISFSLRKGRGK